MRKRDETAALVHWTYSREEWRRFVRWSKLKKGVFTYILHILSPDSRQTTPEVRITPDKVCIGEQHQPFSNGQYRLKKVDIRSEGKMNIIEITYDNKNTGPDEIRILIPRGKLREAIGVQDRLMKN